MRTSFYFAGGLTLLSLAAASGCGGKPNVANDGDGVAGTGMGGEAGSSATGGTGGFSFAGMGGDSMGGAGGMAGGTGGPCDGVMCPDDQRCEVTGGAGAGGATGECVPNDCATLMCSPTEECETTMNGARCVDISCTGDVQCPTERYCDTTEGICKDDECTPFDRQCMGDQVLECAANGSGFDPLVTCSSPTAFTSTCVDQGGGVAGCSCEDDWDCPDFQVCEAGLCTGSGSAPTCRLDPVDFTSVLPDVEIAWGGADETDLDAKLRTLDGVDVSGASPDSPWPASGQVVEAPLVANLDDDNGDGLIDERDFPEIIFLTFCNSGDATANGTLRALHGGGVDAMGMSKKGRDYIASCGANRFFDGRYFDANDMELPSEPACGCDDGVIDSTSTPAVGDLDFDGKPEIVAILEDEPGDGGTDFSKRRGGLLIFDNEGRRLVREPAMGEIDFGESNAYHNPAPALANVVQTADPADDLVEILIGRDLFILDKDAMGNFTIAQRLTGQNERGINLQGPLPCIADLVPQRPGLEMVAGGTVYGIPLDSMGNLDTSATQLVTLANDGTRDGFCAIADIWGADRTSSPSPSNGLDGTPEIILISGGRLYVYALDITLDMMGGFQSLGLTELSGTPTLPGGGNGGGAPNVDDFDGDGFPEVGTAGREGYITFDLQDPTTECPAWPNFGDNQTTVPRTVPSISCTSDADCEAMQAGTACNEQAANPSCVCLHNGWRQRTQDDSSQVTGSSVFDFNGDGAAEVIYNDECNFRIYAGIDGTEITVEPSESRTRVEFPIVADVDNDGNAEIVFATSNESGFCTNRGRTCTIDDDCPSGNHPNGQKCVAGRCQIQDRSVFNNGIEVWGDPGDRWVSARRIWNQHAYHVTNVTEAGGIPRVEPDSWLPLGNRFYNTYRSQPRSFGVAPDLTVVAIQVSSPNAGCGTLSTTIDISVEITNQGDLRVGPGVKVGFEGDFGGTTETLLDSMGQPLEFTIMNSLEPGESLIIQVQWDASNNSRTMLPDSIRAIVDPPTTGMPDGAERECNEANNDLTENVDPGEALADVRLELDDPSGCPIPTVTGELCNDGSLPASDVVIRIFAGDPDAGGELLEEFTVAGPIDPGNCENISSMLDSFPSNRTIRVFGLADPDDSITECNDANNKAGPTGEHFCPGVF